MTKARRAPRSTDGSRRSIARPLRVVLALVACALALVLVAGCGSSSKSSSSSSSASSGASSSAATSASAATGASTTATQQSGIGFAQTALRSEEAVPTYQGPSSGPKPPAGKKIFEIECDSANTGCVSGAEGQAVADKAVGWKTTILNGGGTPTGYSQAMVTAVNDGASGIVLMGISSKSALQGMEAASRAGVPVISQDSNNTPGKSVGDVYAEISGDGPLSGKAIADYFIVASKGHAVVASFHLPSLALTQSRYEGFIAEMHKCGGCKLVSDQTYALTAQGTFANQVKAVLNAHPNIQYVFVDISQYATIAAQAVQQMNLVGKVQVAGVDCLAPETESIKKATGEVACAEDATGLDGWATVNELTRAFAHLPADQESMPFRFLTKQIIDSGSPPYLGSFNAAAGYDKLWGISPAS